jgi:hypothetical protein
LVIGLCSEVGYVILYLISRIIQITPKVLEVSVYSGCNIANLTFSSLVGIISITSEVLEVLIECGEYVESHII